MTSDITAAEAQRILEAAAAKGDASPKDSSSGNGNLGLKGLFAQIANSSAVVVMAVALFIVIFMVREMHSEGMESYERMNQALQKTIDRNTIAIDKLTDEIRWQRLGKKPDF